MLGRSAADGYSGVEIANVLQVKPEAIRHKLHSLNVALRKRIKAGARLRLVVEATDRLIAAASRRGIGVGELVRRLIAQISRLDMFDEILPPVRAHSLGAAAVGEPLVILRQPQFAVVLR